MRFVWSIVLALVQCGCLLAAALGGAVCDERASDSLADVRLSRVLRSPFAMGPPPGGDGGGRGPPRRKPQLAQLPKTRATTTTTTTESANPTDYEAAPDDLSKGDELDDNSAETDESPTKTTQLPARRPPSPRAKSNQQSKSTASSPQPPPPPPADKMNPQHPKRKPLVALPFIKPKNASVCIKEAYLEFPPDLIGNKWRGRGLVVVHVAVVCYMFYSLALVCERYFMPSLEEFAQRLQLSEDVAGATLMSAGSSAPELFTAILGVFIAKGDVGTGAIVGSAVFNILFVIGICAFVTATTAQLNWWPVLRDSVFYTFTVLVLILFIWDERVTALESFTMLALYGLYIVIMIHNDHVRELVTRQLETSALGLKLLSVGGQQANAGASMDGGLDDVFNNSSASSNTIPGRNQSSRATTATGVEEDSMYLAALLIIVRHKRLFKSRLRFQSAARYVICKRQHRINAALSAKQTQEVNFFGPENELTAGAGSNQKQRIQAYASGPSASKNKFSIVSKDDYEFWHRPPGEDENYYLWLAKIPVNYVLHYTVPDCTLYPDKYLFTFFLSILWTAVFSYLMVWMVSLIGYTLGIPDSVMGFTFLAAGTSVPDCYSSIHAARQGMADMAVSNSIGSNVFDILVGLALPWFIQTAIYPGVVATINSRGVIYSVVLLFLSLVVTIYLMNQYEWTLKPRLGLALLIAYGLFIALTCMLEFNLFGHVNPPPCPV